jgi:hypothetical protein
MQQSLHSFLESSANQLKCSTMSGSIQDIVCVRRIGSARELIKEGVRGFVQQ